MIRHFITRDKIRSYRGEGIGALSFYPLTVALELKLAFAVVIVQTKSGDIIQRIRFFNVRSALANHYRQLNFPICLPAVFRNDDITVRSGERGRGLKENNRF